jgi:hypothetical protein
MMKRMFGLAGCCASAGALATVSAVDAASRPSQNCLAILMEPSPVLLPETGRQLTPDRRRRCIRRKGA